LPAARRDLETSRSLHDFEECQSFARIFGDDPAVGCLGFLGRVLLLAGDPEAGCAAGHAAVELARRLGQPQVLATGLALATHLEAWRGNDRVVAQLTAELTSLSQKQSFALWSVVSRFFSAWLRCRAGDPTALDQLSAALVEYDAFGAVLDRPTYAALLSEACWRAGKPELGLQIIEEALCVPPRVRIWDERLRSIAGDCRLALAPSR
jgi:hypothetical protein